MRGNVMKYHLYFIPWPTIFTRPVISHFYAENSMLKVKRHCKGLDTTK